MCRRREGEGKSTHVQVITGMDGCGEEKTYSDDDKEKLTGFLSSRCNDTFFRGPSSC